MRQLTLVLIFTLLSSLKAYSQTYQPMAIEEATWVMGGWGDSSGNSWAFRIMGDSIANGIEYKKLYYYGLEVSQDFDGNWSDRIVISTSLAGLIRDDITEKKVYMKPINFTTYSSRIDDACLTFFTDSDEEQLLFDFSKTISDSIEACMFSEPENDPTILADTLKVEFGQERRILSTSTLNLIEGIGFLNGLFNTASNRIAAGDGLGLVDYCVGSQWDCKLYTAAKDLSETNEIKVFPNPATNELTIESDYQVYNLEIYDVGGQLIFSQENSSSSENERLDISELKSGFYTIFFNFQNKPQTRSAFVKL